MSQGDEIRLQNTHIDGLAVLDTSLGPVAIDLNTVTAPAEMRRFAFLIKMGYFDGAILNRVSPGSFIEFGMFSEFTAEGIKEESAPGIQCADTLNKIFETMPKHTTRRVSEQEDRFHAFGVVMSAGLDPSGDYIVTIGTCRNRTKLRSLIESSGSIIGIVRASDETLQRFTNEKLVCTNLNLKPVWHLSIRAARLVVQPSGFSSWYRDLIAGSDLCARLNASIERRNASLEVKGLTFDAKCKALAARKSASTEAPGARVQAMPVERSVLRTFAKRKRDDRTAAFVEDRTVFVTLLHPDTTAENVKIFFTQFGAITQCVVPKDKVTGASLQYAFVEFSDVASCEMAYKRANGVMIDGRRIKVDFFYDTTDA